MAKEFTINTLLCLEKSLKARAAQLKELAVENSKRTRWLDGNKMDEPAYDVKRVDAKLVKLTKALFNIDMKIKEANARTKVEMDDDFNFDDLMAAID